MSATHPPLVGIPPLVDFDQVHNLVLQRAVGIARLRAALNAPGAPRPILGHGRASKRVWGAAAVIAYFNAIAESGKWPEAEREVA